MLLSDLVSIPPVVNGENIGYDDVSFERDEVDMVTSKEWQDRAKGLLKAELKRRNVSYRELAERLTGMGIPESEANLANKISRGGFTAVFLLQVCEAIGCKSISVATD